MAAEVLQQFDLAQGTLGQDLLAKHIGDLLDGHPFPRCIVGGSADDAVCALTQFFRDGVSFVDNEVLVEDFEDLAAGEVSESP